ncbi:MAG: nucleotidyltransferase domain-containing protein [Sutterellaceae bacterium]|nr:nucleotidyltransferase domain-containing protein [Burkholderiaceae bacterium]MCX7901680.1 nucleotidyltransferase domain-containing protein [Burkholderiaceae bacterium]MDW8429536.1 nucleotidyltransferase domain-containing protein [Sutterellaceae bacterium]
MLHASYEHLMQRLLRECEAYYQARLVSLVLYGSVARGTMRFDSDIDVLLIADALPVGRRARLLEFERIETQLQRDFEAARRCGIHAEVSPLILSRPEVEHGSPLFLDMTLEARILYDREQFFAAYLDGLRARLRQLGAQRRRLRGGYYWLLKPDYRPGDRIEL